MKSPTLEAQQKKDPTPLKQDEKKCKHGLPLFQICYKCKRIPGETSPLRKQYQSKPNCTHFNVRYDNHKCTNCGETIPPSSPLEEKILEFRKKFTLDGPTGEYREMKHEYYLDCTEVEQFISEVIAESYEKGYEDGKEIAERMFNN